MLITESTSNQAKSYADSITKIDSRLKTTSNYEEFTSIILNDGQIESNVVKYLYCSLIRKFCLIPLKIPNLGKKNNNNADLTFLFTWIYLENNTPISESHEPKILLNDIINIILTHDDIKNIYDLEKIFIKIYLSKLPNNITEHVLDTTTTGKYSLLGILSLLITNNAYLYILPLGNPANFTEKSWDKYLLDNNKSRKYIYREYITDYFVDYLPVVKGYNTLLQKMPSSLKNQIQQDDKKDLLEIMSVFIKLKENQKNLILNTYFINRNQNDERGIIKRFKTISEFIKDFKSRIEQASELFNMDTVLKKAMTRKKDIVVVYENRKNNILILKILSFKASKFMGKQTSWCITTDIYNWNNYTNNGQNGQFFIYNFNYSISDINSMIGVTTKTKITNNEVYISDSFLRDDTYIYTDELTNWLKESHINIQEVLKPICEQEEAVLEKSYEYVRILNEFQDILIKRVQKNREDDNLIIDLKKEIEEYSVKGIISLLDNDSFLEYINIDDINSNILMYIFNLLLSNDKSDIVKKVIYNLADITEKIIKTGFKDILTKLALKNKNIIIWLLENITDTSHISIIIEIILDYILYSTDSNQECEEFMDKLSNIIKDDELSIYDISFYSHSFIMDIKTSNINHLIDRYPYIKKIDDNIEQTILIFIQHLITHFNKYSIGEKGMNILIDKFIVSGLCDKYLETTINLYYKSIIWYVAKYKNTEALGYILNHCIKHLKETGESTGINQILNDYFENNMDYDIENYDVILLITDIYYNSPLFDKKEEIVYYNFNINRYTKLSDNKKSILKLLNEKNIFVNGFKNTKESIIFQLSNMTDSQILQLSHEIALGKNEMIYLVYEIYKRGYIKEYIDTWSTHIQDTSINIINPEFNISELIRVIVEEYDSIFMFNILHDYNTFKYLYDNHLNKLRAYIMKYEYEYHINYNKLVINEFINNNDLEVLSVIFPKIHIYELDISKPISLDIIKFIHKKRPSEHIIDIKKIMSIRYENISMKNDIIRYLITNYNIPKKESHRFLLSCDSESVKTYIEACAEKLKISIENLFTQYIIIHTYDLMTAEYDILNLLDNYGIIEAFVPELNKTISNLSTFYNNVIIDYYQLLSNEIIDFFLDRCNEETKKTEGIIYLSMMCFSIEKAIYIFDTYKENYNTNTINHIFAQFTEVLRNEGITNKTSEYLELLKNRGLDIDFFYNKIRKNGSMLTSPFREWVIENK